MEKWKLNHQPSELPYTFSGSFENFMFPSPVWSIVDVVLETSILDKNLEDIIKGNISVLTLGNRLN